MSEPQEDPIETQLLDRIVGSDWFSFEGLAKQYCDLARECAALRRLCREAINCGLDIDDDIHSRLCAAAEGKAVT